MLHILSVAKCFHVMVQAVDAVYFNGGDEKGNFMVAATARRQDNLIQTILLYRVGLTTIGEGKIYHTITL